MKAWRLHKYGKLVDLQLCETRIPNVFRPNQVLVRVQSVSINPIDIAMIGKSFWFILSRDPNII